jgi:hypothetical protein
MKRFKKIHIPISPKEEGQRRIDAITVGWPCILFNFLEGK